MFITVPVSVPADMLPNPSACRRRANDLGKYGIWPVGVSASSARTREHRIIGPPITARVFPLSKLGGNLKVHRERLPRGLCLTVADDILVNRMMNVDLDVSQNLYPPTLKQAVRFAAVP